MIHLRVISPPDTTAHLLNSLNDDSAVLNLEVFPRASMHPIRDGIHFDVLNGAANRVLEQLREAEIVDNGAIAIQAVDACLSERADLAEKSQSRFESFTPVWDLVDAHIHSDGLYPPSWYALLVIAGLIAAVGILTNSQILVVAAMVVGPEYGAITSVARAGTGRDGATVRRGILALGLGFAGSIVACLLLAILVRGSGHTPSAFEIGIRPVSHLINTPDLFSVIVAGLAGIVGIISLTESRASTLIGVFVSVTTIPAAADIGLSLGYGTWSEARGSFFQLLLNVSILIVVGMVMLVIQRHLWDRVSTTSGAPPSTV